MSDKAIELPLLLVCLKLIITAELATIMERGWKLGYFQEASQQWGNCACSRRTCQLWGFLKNTSIHLYGNERLKYTLAACLFQTNLMVNPVLLGWTPDEIHESVMRIRVNTAPLLWAPHISSHSNNLRCVQCCVSMFRDSGNCSTFKSSYFHSLGDSEKTENPNQFTINKEIGTFRTQRTVKICDFRNTGYQHFLHTAISASKPAWKCRLKEKLMDLKYPCSS